MQASLTNPWFEAEYIGNIQEDGSFEHGLLTSLEGAQGIRMFCPCGFGKDNAHAHGLIVCFRNPRGAPIAPANFPSPDREMNPRWSLTGTGLQDLSLEPSIAVGGDRQCWHGYITNGVVRSC